MTDTPEPPNHLREATQQAIARTRERLLATPVDLALAAAQGGLRVDEQGRVAAAFLGRLLRVNPGTLTVVADDGRPVRGEEEMLLLRYLEFGREVRPTGEAITFRNLPGGTFYFDPVSRRTTDLLVKVFGNDLERFKKALARYPHTELALGDYSARVQALGRLDVTLVYHQGDEEFAPALDFLYDRVIAGIFHTDEVAALATRLALGLIKDQ